MINKPLLDSALVLAASLLLSLTADARRIKSMPNPDFTQGERIPDGAVHNWTLGATGARGWMYTEKMSTVKARQIYITEVAKGAPADGVLQLGDVILGIGDQPFACDPRTEFGKALTVAESKAGAGKFKLLRWRAGKQEIVTVQLPVLGTYSATAPYDCPKSKRILEQGCKALAERMQDPDYGPNPIPRSLNALALLASGDESYLPFLKNEAQWASNYSVDRFSTWYYGYVLTFLAEYAMVTGDESVVPGMRRLALESARGQSSVGSWGHKFADENGRLAGYGMMNAPGVPLTIALELSRRAGLKDQEISDAIELSAKLLRFYIGKGAVPYGDHSPWMQSHEDNGKCGMAAVLFNLLEEKDGAKFFSRMSLASHGAERDTGHTGNYWNIIWAMPAVNLSGPQATGAWMEEFGAWYYDLARGYDGLFTHQGPPQPHDDASAGWDASGLHLLAYAMPLKKLIITGRLPATTPQLDAAEAQSIIHDGRGWSQGDKFSTYDALTIDELIERLASWSPIVRERAAIALSRKESAPLKVVIAMLDAESPDERLGACQALAAIGANASAAEPELTKLLKADDMWLRINAAMAIAGIGSAGQPVVNDLLKMLARGPSAEDPRAMEQRYMCYVLFNPRNGLLSKSVEGVDPEPLKAGMRSAMQNEDGRARHCISKVYPIMPEDELKTLLPEIYQAVVNPAPSGIMFADDIRIEGLKRLSEWKVAEGIDACTGYLTHQNHWQSEKRTPILLGMLGAYGVHAKRCIPELEKLAAEFEILPDFFPEQMRIQKAADVRATIDFLKQTDERPELISIH